MTADVEVGGHRIAFEVSGAGAPLILLHPLALAGRVWGEFADRLAEHFRVVALDIRGHGESSWDRREFSISDLASDLGGVMDALDIRSAHLLGMSMGGSVALTFAGLWPQRVEGMVLADTTAWYGEDAGPTWDERARKAVALERSEQVPFQTQRWFTDEFRAERPDLVQRVVEVFVSTDSSLHAAASRAMGGLDSRDLLGDISAPTLVLCGDEDYATPPEMAHLIADQVRDGRAEIVPNLRHLSLIERPDLAADVIAHLEEVA